MMKRVFILTFLLSLLLILVACDNGSVSEPAASKSSSLVKVCLNVDGCDYGLQKVVAEGTPVGGNYWASLTYQYNAVPQWRDPADAAIQGTAGWTEINYSSGMSLGYFAPGQWIFGVRILDGTAIVYQGFSEVVNIKNSLEPIDVFVSKLAAESVRISVTASTVQGDSLSISYKNASDVSFGPYTANATRLNGLTTFEYNINNLDPQTYRFTLTYSSSTGTPVAPAMQQVELGSGKKAVISGSLNDGNLQLSCTTVSVYNITLLRYNWDNQVRDYDTGTGSYYYGNVVANTVSAVAGDRVSFYVEPISESSIDINAPPSVNDGAIDLVSNGNLYSFIMPEGNVNVKVKFTEPQHHSIGINLNHFKTIIQEFYREKSDYVKAFGRADVIPAGVEYLGIKDVMIWYANEKIWWYSKADDHTLKFDASISTDMSNLFKDCSKYEYIDMTGIDTSNITKMNGMFENCLALKVVDLNGINTSNVDNMEKMFYKAGYNYVPVKTQAENAINMQDNSNNLLIKNMHFDTHKVTNMARMFQLSSINNLCSPEPRIDNNIPSNITEWNTSLVSNMSFMFAGEYTKNPQTFTYFKIKSLDLSRWNTGNVRNFSNMFEYCNRLDSFSMVQTDNNDNIIHQWDFSSAEDINRMFDRCESITSITFPTQTVLDNVTTMSYIFSACDKLDEAAFADILSRWDIDALHNSNDIFTLPATSDENVPNRIFKAGKNAAILSGNAKYFKTFRHENDEIGNIVFGGSSAGTNMQNQCLVWYTPPEPEPEPEPEP